MPIMRTASGLHSLARRSERPACSKKRKEDNSKKNKIKYFKLFSTLSQLYCVKSKIVSFSD